MVGDQWHLKVSTMHWFRQLKFMMKVLMEINEIDSLFLVDIMHVHGRRPKIESQMEIVFIPCLSKIFIKSET
jgi:hypothetical protein